MPGLSCGMQTLSCGMHVGSSSLTRDRTRAPCIGSMESSPLHHQGNPWLNDFLFAKSQSHRIILLLSLCQVYICCAGRWQTHHTYTRVHTHILPLGRRSKRDHELGQSTEAQRQRRRPEQMHTFSVMDVGEGQGGMQEQQPRSWGWGAGSGAETALPGPPCLPAVQWLPWETPSGPDGPVSRGSAQTPSPAG